MIFRKLLSVFIFLFVFSSFSQNKKIVFGFNEIPQTLMVNPGADVDFQWHAGVPMLSGNYLHAGISGLTLNNLFANDGININTKIANLLTKLDNKNFYTINQQIEIFNIGYRLENKKDYLSFGFYQEFDGIAYHPKDLVTLAYEGNQNFDKKFKLHDLSFKAEMLGVYHIGLSRKLNDKLTIGGRIKLYSSAFNSSSTQNYGLLFTEYGDNNIYRHRLQDVDISVNTSGIAHDEKAVLNEKNIFGKLLFSGNVGAGIDFGLTYKINKKWTTSASLLDLGFIRHTTNTTVYDAQDSQDIDGIHVLFPTENPINYLQEFNDEINYSFGSQKFTTLRSLKINGSLTYQFGQTNNRSCIRTTYENTRRNEVGLQLFSVFRPKRPQVAATLFYYKRLAKFLRAKLTYTIDEYSAKNIGFGLSTHIGMFNMYGAVDNVFGLADLSASSNQTINFGINVILDFDETKP